MKKLSSIFLFIFILGVGVRAINIWRPVDRPTWRESDEAGIARNYYREGMNIFYPRVDWRGDTAGYAEMEFPLYPWLIALSYKIFGFHEFIGRVISFLFSLLTLWIFFRLAWDLLPPLGAQCAALFFALSPLVINVSSALQPEALMFLFYLLAGYWFICWHQNRGEKFFWGSAVAISMAILAKVTAAHLGVFFGLLILEKVGFAALMKLRFWGFGAIALIPSVLWYIHAHQFWQQNQLSLGLSNEYHWVGWDLFTNPFFVKGLARTEAFYVWMPLGMVILAIGVWLNRREKAVKYAIYWGIAVAVYYLLAARTTAAQWAAYYHIASVPTVALLLGSGAAVILQLKSDKRWLKRFVALSGMSALVLVLTSYLLLSGTAFEIGVVLSATLALTTLVLMERMKIGAEGGSRLQTLLLSIGVISLCSVFLFQTRQIVVDAQNWKASELRSCAPSFATEIPASALVLVTGGSCVNETGYPAAYNASFMLYWTDRRGFNICIEEQSLAAVASFVKHGARYYLAAKSTLQRRGHLEDELRQVYPVVAECNGNILFQLTPVETKVEK